MIIDHWLEVMNTSTHILESAEKLFLHYGFRKTTVADVARVAGVAKGSIYLHFDSKEDLLFNLIRVRTQDFLDELESILQNISPARLALTDGLLEFMARALEARTKVASEDLGIDFSLITKILDTHREAEPRLSQILYQALEKHCRETESSMDISEAAWLLSETIMFILIRTIKDLKFDWRRYISTMTRLMLPQPEVEI